MSYSPSASQIARSSSGSTCDDKRFLKDIYKQRPIIRFQTLFLQDPVINVEKKKLYFKGVGGTEMKEHEVTMEFFKEIDPEKSKFAVRPREVRDPES